MEPNSLEVVQQFEDVLDFPNEAAEADFWSTHTLREEPHEAIHPLYENVRPTR
jgi:hypothetical protein